MHHGMFETRAERDATVAAPAPGDTAIAALIIEWWTGTAWQKLTGDIGGGDDSDGVFCLDDSGSGQPDLGNSAYSTTLDD